MNREEMLKIWEEFTKGNDFKLNPDEEHVSLIIEGLQDNEDNFGQRFCPCRLRDGSRKRDLELLCPCNFKMHGTWKSRGDCWCGLFVKR